MADGKVVYDIVGDNSKFADTVGKSADIAKKGFDSVGKVGKTAFTAIGAAAATAGVGVIALGKSALTGYAEYEQLTGGVETLFKESADLVMGYAENAYKTAGLSANEYMATVTSFSASLLQSLGGDTEKAAEKADMAVTDMADNANKMGTSMELIQNAYQGFAKANYTMLDNLKLGYGGTKEEMGRLLEDAEAISGIEYDISSYADVVDAIHVIQTEIGITGTTALEASETIQGSVAAMGAAWENLTTGMADENADLDKLMGNFIDSVVTVGENIIPRIQTLLPRMVAGIGQLVTALSGKIGPILGGLLPAVMDSLSATITALVGSLTAFIADNSDMLYEAGETLLYTFVDGIREMLPLLSEMAASFAPLIVEGLMQYWPVIFELGITILSAFIQGIADNLGSLIPLAQTLLLDLAALLLDNSLILATAGLKILTALITGILEVIPEIIPQVIDIITAMVEVLTEGLPELALCGVALLTALVDKLPDIVITIIKAIPVIVGAVVDAVLGSIPELIAAGIALFIALVENLNQIIDAIVAAVPEIVEAVLAALTDNLPEIIGAGVDLFVALIQNLPTIIETIVSAVPKIIAGVLAAFTKSIPDMLDMGKRLIEGLWNGISNAGEWLRDKISGFFGGVVDSIKDFFGIASPSKLFELEIGKNLALGLAVGMEKNADAPVEAAEKMSLSTVEASVSSSLSAVTPVQSSPAPAFDALAMGQMIQAMFENTATQKLEITVSPEPGFTRYMKFELDHESQNQGVSLVKAVK